ncbi:hypothetical protein CSA37_03385 [Candidatus Fermentibacteria bacterium]|nr:MAG: hypothetical protein CSA37_03385 [Candidatus Fermentibacteria bacterium]
MEQVCIRGVFSQLMDHFPHKAFARIVREYSGDYKVQHFPCSTAWPSQLPGAFKPQHIFIDLLSYFSQRSS